MALVTKILPLDVSHKCPMVPSFLTQALCTENGLGQRLQSDASGDCPGTLAGLALKGYRICCAPALSRFATHGTAGSLAVLLCFR